MISQDSPTWAQLWVLCSQREQLPITVSVSQLGLQGHCWAVWTVNSSWVGTRGPFIIPVLVHGYGAGTCAHHLTAWTATPVEPSPGMSHEWPPTGIDKTRHSPVCLISHSTNTYQIRTLTGTELHARVKWCPGLLSAPRPVASYPSVSPSPSSSRPQPPTPLHMGNEKPLPR